MEKVKGRPGVVLQGQEVCCGGDEADIIVVLQGRGDGDGDGGVSGVGSWSWCCGCCGGAEGGVTVVLQSRSGGGGELWEGDVSWRCCSTYCGDGVAVTVWCCRGELVVVAVMLSVVWSSVVLIELFGC